MEFAPKGLNVGDVFEDNGKKYRVTQVYDYGYNTEEAAEEPEQIELSDLPFSDVDDEIKAEKKKRTTRAAKK